MIENSTDRFHSCHETKLVAKGGEEIACLLHCDEHGFSLVGTDRDFATSDAFGVGVTLSQVMATASMTFIHPEEIEWPDYLTGRFDSLQTERFERLAR